MVLPADLEIRYKDLFELAADAILTGDPEGKIIGANPKASELSGYPREELLGCSIALLFSPTEQARVPLRYDLLKAGKVVQSERLLTRKNGSTVAISMNSRMMPDGTYHTFMRDITDQKALEEKLKASNRELEAFVYTVSHDLRTPLSTIIGYLDFLQETDLSLNENTREILHSIEHAGEGMLATLEDLLALATAGNLERPLLPVDLTRVRDNVLHTQGSRLEAKGFRVVKTALPAIHVPESYLEQIFNNLIGNALNYAGTGGRLEIGGEKTTAGVEFYVRDYGPGIAAKDHLRIFEAFFRGKSAGENQGTGVGLAIVRKIARACGGEAWLEETPGGGCTFRVRLESLPAS